MCGVIFSAPHIFPLIFLKLSLSDGTSQPSLNAFMGKDNHKGLGATVVTSSKSKSTKNDSDRGIKEGDTKRIKKVTPNKSGGGGFGGPK